MPGGISGDSHLKDALSSMLNQGQSLEKRLIAASKKILLQKIEFESAKRSSSLFPLQALRAKYTPLNASAVDLPSKQEHGKTGSSQHRIKDDGISLPSRVLCPPDSIELAWSAGRRVGAGLANLGNTCFLNATLQCLTYTAPLVNYLQSSNHCKGCRINGFCMMCELQKHVQQCFSAGHSCIKPLSILQKLRLIARHMRWGRQEDAHEFLRYVVEALQKANLVGLQNLDQRSKETNAVNQIFGGYLCSQVTCLQCHEKSNTFDPFLDLSMDVRNVTSVELALGRFVHPELLSKDNAYLCARCKCKVTARKAFTIHRAPNVLTIQLKRYGVHGGKVTRHISFGERLNLRPYMSVSRADPLWYRLYAVLVHDGSSTNSGHYYCYVRAPGGTWHCMNDSSVHPTSVQRILSAEAYILFYTVEQKATALSVVANGNGDGRHKVAVLPSLGKAVMLEEKLLASEPKSEKLQRSKSESDLKPTIVKPAVGIVTDPSVAKTNSIPSTGNGISNPPRRNQPAVISEPSFKPATKNKQPAVIADPKVRTVNADSKANNVNGVSTLTAPVNDFISNGVGLKSDILVSGTKSTKKPAENPVSIEPNLNGVSGKDKHPKVWAEVVPPRPSSQSEIKISEKSAKPRRHSDSGAAEANESIESHLSDKQKHSHKHKHSQPSAVICDRVSPSKLTVVGGSTDQRGMDDAFSLKQEHRRLDEASASMSSSEPNSCSSRLVTSINANGKPDRHCRHSGSKSSVVPESSVFQETGKTNGVAVEVGTHGLSDSAGKPPCRISTTCVASGVDATPAASTTRWRVLKVHREERKRRRTFSPDGVHATTTWRVSETVTNDRDVDCSVTANGNGRPTKMTDALPCNGFGAVSSALRGGGEPFSGTPDVEMVDSSGNESMETSSSQASQKTGSSKKTSTRKDSKCHVQQWDQLLPRGYRSAGVERTTNPVKQMWDGSGDHLKADVSRELESLASSGYGTEVSTWDGGRSLLAEQIEEDRKWQSKRRHSDEYDEELDRGRVRTFKKYRQDEPDYVQKGRKNPFQQAQDFKLLDKEAKLTGIYSWKNRQSL